MASLEGQSYCTQIRHKRTIIRVNNPSGHFHIQATPRALADILPYLVVLPISVPSRMGSQKRAEVIHRKKTLRNSL